MGLDIFLLQLELIKANNEALYNGGMDDNNISADIVDQANSYIDSNVEMKAINRQIKLILWQRNEFTMRPEPITDLETSQI